METPWGVTVLPAQEASALGRLSMLALMDDPDVPVAVKRTCRRLMEVFPYVEVVVLAPEELPPSCGSFVTAGESTGPCLYERLLMDKTRLVSLPGPA